VVDSGSVLAEGSGTFSAPDAAIDVNGDSSFGSVASGGSLNVGVENTNGAFIGGFDNNTNSWVIGDSAVANSDNSYQVSLPATDSLALPDQSIEVNNVVEGAIPSVGTIDINLSDGTNVITPTSVAVTGRVVDIELAAGAVMAVDFVADKLVVTAGETITFTDLTNNSPTNWGWFFNGDGVSNLQNPTFSFPTLGFKNITLFAAKTGLGGFTTKSNYIQINGLLDSFPNAAAAYSLRLMRLGYTGSAIRVRRSNDNAEQDIGFVNDVLDTAALLAFVGANNGFVVTWYDQSGNGVNATQGTQANQPQIVSSGSVLLLNGLPTIKFDGTNDFLLTSNYNFIATDKIYAASVSSVETNNATRLIFKLGDNSTYRSFDASYFQGTGRFAAQYSTNNTSAQTNAYNTYNVNQQYLLESLFDTNNVNIADRINIYANNSILTFNSNTNDFQGNMFANNRPLSIGADGLGNFRMQGNIQEIVFYPFDQATNRSNISNNIRTFYGI
jgi:PKD repeat protein